MRDIVQHFIIKEKLLANDAKVIVGLSGGMDSMVLMDILLNLGYVCIAAHCNFHLRGEESNRDADFVKKWCEKRKIRFISIDFDTIKYAADNKISIEMAARDLRYEWFNKICKQFNADAIAVAHHKDDSIETVLLNLIRGTGIKGLTGISAKKNNNIVRPLLCLTRSDIEDYTANNDLPYVTDSTNNEDIYVRNSLRINAIPLLEKINPSVKESIFRTSKNLSEVEKIYIKSIEKSIQNVFSNNKIDISLLKEEVSPQSILFEILSPLGFSPSTIDDVFESVDSSPGKIFYSDSHRLIKDRDFFLLDDRQSSEFEDEIFYINNDSEVIYDPIKLIIKKVSKPIEINKNSRYLYADELKLKFPLELRKWKKGDWFVPFGMKGRKKLSDYFTDRKLSLIDKEDVWVLLSGGDVVWIVGERSDERFKVNRETKNIIIIEYIDK